MTRIGWLGGTFDPVHAGHLDVAEAAIRAIGLDQVIFLPANVPPHRALPRASAAHRFAMTALATLTREGLTVSDLEMGSDDPSYTSTTLDRMASRGMDTRALFFITGADAFSDIETWKDYPAILDRCHFVAVSRPGRQATTLRSALPALSERMIDTPCTSDDLTRPRVVLVNALTAQVSSTDIRRRLADHESIAGLVPDSVARYIETHGLYQISPKAYGQI